MSQQPHFLSNKVMNKKTRKSLEARITQIKTPFESYIDEELRSEYDSTKRTFYIVLQKQEVPSVQVAVYRIIEHLNKSRGVELLLAEGIMHNDLSDIQNPEEPLEYKHPDIVRLIESGLDELLLDIFIKFKARGDSLIGLTYAGLKMAGYEEPQTYQIDRKSRSANALKYALQRSNELYGSRIIKNKDAVIVIGVDNLADYASLQQDAINGRTDYNLVFIWPKGTK